MKMAVCDSAVCEKPNTRINAVYVLHYLQLVRQLQGQEENPFGDDASTTPKKIFQLLNQVIFSPKGNSSFIKWFVPA